MHLSKKTHIAYLKVDEAFAKVFTQYADFIDNFLLKLVIKLPKYIEINDHAIEFINNQQPFYDPIYSLNQVELEILKTYIKNIY